MEIHMSDYTLASLLVLVSTVTVSSATSNIHDKTATRIIVDPSSFVDEEIEVVEYPGQSTIQCFAVFLTMQDTYKTFCHLPTGGCMASDVEFPVNYDDMSTGHGYVCYTTALPLIDRAAALAACAGSAAFCCPPPFRKFSETMCIYYSGFFRQATFDGARISCRSYWPGTDLYTGPIPDSDVKSQIIFAPDGPWVGVHQVSPGNWIYIDGSALPPNPWVSVSFGGLGILGGSEVTPNCGFLWLSNPILIFGDWKLSEGICGEYRPYICQIT